MHVLSVERFSRWLLRRSPRLAPSARPLPASGARCRS